MKVVGSLTLIFMLVSSIFCYGQDDGAATTYTSEDLISSYYDEDFQPFRRGVGFTKLSFALSDKSLTNAPRLFDSVIDGQDFSWNLQLSGGYFLGNYFMVGGSFGYDESKFTGSVLNLDNDTIFTQSLSRSFNIAPYLRIAIPLTRNQRLSFYNDIGVSFGYGRTLVRDTQNLDEIDKEFGDQFIFGIGMSPGVTFFLVQNFALEAGINIIGYRLNIENIEDGQGLETRRVEHDVSFKLNLLSLNLGLAYFIGTK